MSIVSLDLETTGLDERIHEAWEVALVDSEGREACWQLPMRMRYRDASPEALRIGGWYERFRVPGLLALRTHGEGAEEAMEATHAVHEMTSCTDGATLMGCAIQFDMRFLADLYRYYGVEPNWHHRGLDLGSYAAGVEGWREPLSSAQMQEFVSNEEAHTALGDAKWNWQLYHYLQAGQSLNV